jgi:membrane associated rhomboid family serine protease
MAALLVFAQKVGADMRSLWALIAINVLLTFAIPNISWQGHLGGFIGGGGVAALLVVAHKQRADVSQLMIWIGINAALTFFASGISWQGHVGGFVGGLALAGVLVYSPRASRTTWQVAGFAGVTILVALAFALRTAALT